MASFQGPVRPGTSESVFRETGRTQREYQGPVRPGTDVEKFRRTGRSSSRTYGPTRADFEAEQQRQAQAQKVAQEKARKEAEEKKKLEEARRKAQAEKVKIENLRRDLIRRGNQEQTRILKNKEGQRIRQSIVKNNSQTSRVIISRNLDTGEVRYRSFGRPGVGYYVTQTGGVTESPSKMDKTIKKALEKAEKLLPSGINFRKDKWGNIIDITDNKRGLSVSLTKLQNYIAGAKLIELGLAEKMEAPKEVITPLFKKIVSAFNIKKFKKYRETQRQDLYNLYGLKGKNRNFWSLANAARTRPLNPSQQNEINDIVLKNLKQDLINPDSAIRAEAALIVSAVVGGPLLGGAIGAIYKTPIALAKDLGVGEELGDITWKQVAKRSGYEFGKNALESYFMMKMFGLGAKGVSKIAAIRIFPRGIKPTLLTKSIILSQKAFKIALKKGLDVVGAQYLSSIGIDVAKTIKKIKEKKYKAATVGASGLLGNLVGFYGEKAVKKALRKVTLAEDPRLIITKGMKGKPFAIESRDITIARLEKARKVLKGKKLKVKFAKATPVKEPRKVKIVTPEKRVARGVKIDVPTPAGYATYAVGKEVYIIPKTFLEIRKGNTPKTYYKKWFQSVKKKGLLPTFKELGMPKTYSPTIYKGSGEYLPRNKGESLKKYYARALKVANKRKIVQVVAAPKTVLGGTQPELEIKTIYPNPKGVKSSVTRVKVGKDAFGHDVIVEIVAPKSILQRLKFKIKTKIEFKKEALKYLTNRESKIAKDLSKRIINNYDFIYKSKLKGAKDARKHMLQVEKNFRKLLKHYNIKASEAEIKAVSRLHDILKLRGLNVKDEPIIRKALLEGYLNKIPLVKKLKPAELKRVANTIGWHQDVNPKTLRALKVDKFTKAFINADRLDITRYGDKVKLEKLFSLKAKKLIPKKILKEFTKLNKLKIRRKGFTKTLRKKYNALIKKYPQLKNKKIENRLIKENKARYKKLSPKEKARIKAQEKEYKDYKESLSEYQRLKRGKKIRPIAYKTKQYKSYKTPKLKMAYKSGYKAGESIGKYKPKNYKTNKGRYQNAYAKGYKAAYKGNYKINYKTGKHKPKKYKVTKYISTSRKPPKKPTPIPLIIIPKKFKQKKIRKAQPVFYVKVRRRGKIVNLTPRPLLLRDAKDFLAYTIDNGLSRSAWFEPMGRAKTILIPPKKIKGYFSKNSRKLRPFKIRVGKRKLIRNGYIEKKKYIGDTKREIKQLRATIKKYKKKIRKRNIRKRNQKKNNKKKRIIRRRKIRRKIIRQKPVRRKIKRRRKPVRRKVKRRKPTTIISRRRKKAVRKLPRKNTIKKRPIKRTIKRKKRVIRRKPTKRRIKRRKPIKRKRKIRRKPIKRKVKKRRK